MEKENALNTTNLTKALLVYKAELHDKKHKCTPELNDMILILGDMINKEEDDFTREYIREEVIPYFKENGIKFEGGLNE